MKKTRTYFEFKRAFLVEALFLLVIPVFMMQFFDHLRILRYVFLCVGLAYLYVFAKKRRLGAADFGISGYQLQRSLGLTLGLTVIMGGLLYGSFRLIPEWYQEGLHSMRVINLPGWMIIGLYVGLSVPLQELVFRGIMIKRLELILQNSWLIIGMSAGIFALAHVIFKSPMIVVITFLGGLVWGWLFVRYRNLWPIQISHAVLGGILIWLGMG